MRYAILILLLASTAQAQVYVWTNPVGRTCFDTSRDGVTDAVGAVSTNDAAPWIAPTPVEPQEFTSGIWISSTSSYLIVRMNDGHDYAITPTDDGRVIAPQVSFSPLEMDKVPGYVEAEKAKDAARRQRIVALKESPEWAAITNNLAQYELHESQWATLRATATNAIALTTGNNKAALNAMLNLAEKERQARDDVKAIANRTKGLLLDIVKDAQ